jgi:RNA recognition motif-containing protein
VKKESNMASRISVENLPPDITEERLRDIFSQIGEVQSVRIQTDLLTRRPTGRGFVEMSLDVDAYRAVDFFEGATIQDRKIHLVEEIPLIDRAKDMLAHAILQQRLNINRWMEKHHH